MTTDGRAVSHPPNPNDLTTWAHQMRAVPGAHILPSADRGLIQESGVFDADMSYCHDAVLWRRRALMVPPADVSGVTFGAPLKGTYLWGGVIHGHFGHFLVESLGRIWGYAEAGGAVDGILFMEKRASEPDNADTVAWHSDTNPILRDFQTQMFAHLGIAAKIGIVTAPLQVETLLVPGQGFGMGAMAAGTPKFKAFVQGRIGQDIPAEGPERLYLSRSAYGARRGGVIGEPLIEARLEQDGYTVLHPQKEDLRTQIARYKAAREVVALDGSALHLLAMVAPADQKVAMIKRRSSPISKGIETHLTSFMGAPPLVIDAIKQNWIRSDRKRVDRFSLAELDLPAVGAALADAGMASAGGWDDLPQDTRDGILQEVTADSKLSFRPQDAPAPAPQKAKLPKGIVAACHGIQVPKSHAVGPKWLVRKINNGRYEKEEITGALHLVTGKDRVLECGGGIGIVGTTVAHNCKPAEIRTFEANPHMIDVINATYKHNKVQDRISVTHGALMSGKDVPDTITFNISKRFAFSSLDAPQRELSEQVTVPVHDFATVKADFAPTVLLMDIEGGELGFLEGADLSGINVVVMEFHPDVYGMEGMERCKSLIRKAGLEPVKAKSTETVWAAQRVS